MRTGKSKELKSIICEFIYSYDLVDVVFDMIDARSLFHNSNTPLEFIDLKSLKECFRHIVYAKNKHVNRQFISDNVHIILAMSTWRYLVLNKITVDLELFNKLPEDVKHYLVQTYPFKLNVPKKILMDYCESYLLGDFAESPMTGDEIKYILSLHCDTDHVYELYDTLASYQCLTKRHLNIMKKRNPKIAAEIIERYY
jgi:hypothetical protein